MPSGAGGSDPERKAVEPAERVVVGALRLPGDLDCVHLAGERVQDLLREVDRLEKLVSGIRDFAHREETPAEDVNLNELLREQFQLALPMKPLCSDECRGLCPAKTDLAS